MSQRVATRGLSWPIRGGKVRIDEAAWKHNASAIIARSSGVLRDDNGQPTRALSDDEFASKDSELIACEVECRRDGIEGICVQLDIPGLDEYLAAEDR